MNVLELPFPPSLNTYWRHPTKGKLAGRHLISEKGREYRQAVIDEASRYQLAKLAGRLSVHIDAFPPDNRRRDLDNMMKGLLDGLVHAQVIEDDSQIDKLSIERGVVCKGGRVRVFVSEYRNGCGD
ncbi:RusA family crossover junction endodeoxyribonuclease [Achromobacter sp. ACM05]|uniref:RusA family crossover junction endodeoxyribonuclease n=1 Tax=Achromobacter sp. ACM05 TaxID=2854776 RepID=UPI001C43E9DB|nr:RusA family crossover junction endodeoxyribonuclease [Achromobacter sp. ACM05]MBV7502082.1 RusA family crossover junction endodeoxyribonuclease [Achromobacter sp. ACM05]